MNGNIDDILTMTDSWDILEVEQVLYYAQFALECSCEAREHEQGITLVVKNGEAV